MYTCRKCNKSLEENDRYCFNCGSYIGEPIKNKENWEAVNYKYNNTSSSSEYVAVESKSLSEKINNENIIHKKITLKEHLRILKLSTSEMGNTLDNISFKFVSILTIIMFFLISFLYANIVKWSLKIPNDLIKIIIPFNIVRDDYIIRFNIPSSSSKVFMYALLGLIVSTIISFVLIYWEEKIYAGNYIEIKKLWSTLILAYIPYAATLMSFLLISLINRTISFIIFDIGILLTILIFFNYIKLILSSNRKAIFIAAASIIISYFISYMYIFILFA